MATLRPLKNDIVFQFVDDVTLGGRFVEGMTTGGIILGSSNDDSAKRPRWGKVVAVGPDCTTIRPGEEVLMPALRWTLSAKFEGERVWKTRESELVARRTGPTGHLHVLNNWLVFKHDPDKIHTRRSGLFIVTKQTPHSKVLHAGPDSERVLEHATIYYSDSLFEDRFRHNGEDLAFIKDTDVLAYQLHE